MTFSDGTCIKLNPDDIVVFVGPNNAGKSAALREIELHLEKSVEPKYVLSGLKTKNAGTNEELRAAVEDHSRKVFLSGSNYFVGSGYMIPETRIRDGWTEDTKLLKGFFCSRLKTESRITDSNSTNSFKVLSEPATRPIQMAYGDSRVEARLSSHFRSAFNLDLIVMKGGGSEIPLLVGERPPLAPGEDPTKWSYLERLMKSAVPLDQQGDGMRSFVSVILEMLVPQNPSVLLLDEPEAFLHPPQARLMGEILARERRPNTQMFISTHSSDILHGLLNVAPDQLRIIRLQRAGNKNHGKELSKEKARSISRDPLMKYSSVLTGIFHQRAIICESDADCLFYQALLSQTVKNGANADVLFLHTSGKPRIATMAEALRALGVPVDVIADIDLMRDDLPRVISSICD